MAESAEFGFGARLVMTLFSADDVFTDYRLSGQLAEETLTEWQDLLSGRIDVGGYRDIVATLSDIDAREPIAASLIAIRAYLAWEGAVTSGQVSEPATHGGWQTILVPLLRTLMRAGALWAPRELANGAADYLSSTWQFIRQNERTWQLFEAVEELQGEAERRCADCLAEVAMQIHDGLDDAETRSRLAALYLSMGDVPRASALGRGRYRPSYRRLRRLVIESFARLEVDPLVQQVWIRLAEHLASVRGVQYKLRTRYRSAGDIVTSMGIAYADGLAAVSRLPPDPAHPAPTPPELSDLFFLMAMHGGDLRDADASAWLRVVTLEKSAAPLVGGLGSWQDLVATAASDVRRASGMAADADAFDVSPGIACHYLTGELPDVLSTMEQYRAAALWYWRQLLPGGSAGQGSDAQRDRLRKEVSGARFAQSFLRLPRVRLRIQGSLESGGERDFAQLIRRAADPGRIAALTAELAALAAEGSHVTADRPASVDDLARSLMTSGPSQGGAA